MKYKKVVISILMILITSFCFACTTTAASNGGVVPVVNLVTESEKKQSIKDITLYLSENSLTLEELAQELTLPQSILRDALSIEIVTESYNDVSNGLVESITTAAIRIPSEKEEYALYRVYGSVTFKNDISDETGDYLVNNINANNFIILKDTDFLVKYNTFLVNAEDNQGYYCFDIDKELLKPQYYSFNSVTYGFVGNGDRKKIAKVEASKLISVKGNARIAVEIILHKNNGSKFDAGFSYDNFYAGTNINDYAFYRGKPLNYN